MYSSALQRRTKKNGFAYIITDFIQKKKKTVQAVHKYRIKVSLQTPAAPGDTPCTRGTSVLCIHPEMIWFWSIFNHHFQLYTDLVQRLIKQW